MGELRKRIIGEVSANLRVPMIGQKVWLIYEDCIFVDTVYCLGKDTFIILSFNRNTKNDFWEWRYKDFGKRWFTDFASAKKELLCGYGEEYGLVEHDTTWYEVVIGGNI